MIALLAAALALIPSLFGATLCAFAVAIGLHLRRRRVTPVTGHLTARRLRWHWPAMVAAFEGLGSLAWALACRLPSTQQAAINAFIEAAAATAIVVPVAVVASCLLERLATRERRFVPGPVLAGVAGVAMSWAMVLWVLLPVPLQYVA